MRAPLLQPARARSDAEGLARVLERPLQHLCRQLPPPAHTPRTACQCRSQAVPHSQIAHRAPTSKDKKT
eukprot:3937384-Rhodomonas_salina.1